MHFERNFNINLPVFSTLNALAALTAHLHGHEPKALRSTGHLCVQDTDGALLWTLLFYCVLCFLSQIVFCVAKIVWFLFLLFFILLSESLGSFSCRHRNSDPMAAKWTGWPEFPSRLSVWGILWSSQARNVRSVQGFSNQIAESRQPPCLTPKSIRLSPNFSWVTQEGHELQSAHYLKFLNIKKMNEFHSLKW